MIGAKGTATFNAWMGKNAIRLMRMLNMGAPLNEDAFQEAYLSLADCRRKECGPAFEKAFMAAYRKISRRAASETYSRAHPDDAFFARLQTAQAAEPSDQRRAESQESLAQAIRAHIRTAYSREEVAIWEMRMEGASVRDIADALGMSRAAADSAMRRIAEQTSALFAHALQKTQT